MKQTYLEKINQRLSQKLNWQQAGPALETLTQIQSEMSPHLSWEQAQEQVIWQLEKSWNDPWLNFYWSQYCDDQKTSSTPKAA